MARIASLALEPQKNWDVRWITKDYTDHDTWCPPNISFKARYQRPEKHGDVGWKGLAAVPWRGSREEAQTDLDHLAEKRGWMEWNG